MVKRKPPKAVLEYINRLKRNYPGVRDVYLFGSYARGLADNESDIDIAVVFDELEDTFDMQLRLMKLRREYDLRIEPHVFRSSDLDETHPLSKEIMEAGLAVG